MKGVVLVKTMQHLLCIYFNRTNNTVIKIKQSVKKALGLLSTSIWKKRLLHENDSINQSIENNESVNILNNSEKENIYSDSSDHPDSTMLFSNDTQFNNSSIQHVGTRRSILSDKSNWILLLLFINLIQPYFGTIYDFTMTISPSHFTNKKTMGQGKNITQRQPSTKSLSSGIIETLSKKMTVKVVAFENEKTDSGTGFIFEKHKVDAKKFRYYILTVKHISNRYNQNSLSLSVITSQEKQEGRIFNHSNEEQKKKYLQDLSKYDLKFIQDKDLQIIYFESDKEYTAATLSGYDEIRPWDKVYIRGYSCENEHCSDNKQSKFIKSRIGKIDLLPANFTLVNGYSIPYIDGVESGTSGSPVFNEYGEVIAVNGIDRHAQGLNNPYLFNDNSEVNKETKEIMNFFSWGIDIRKFKKML
jgi:hypothetical protein